MDITAITSFLVKPGKNLAMEEECPGIDVPLHGLLYDKLREVFLKSDIECDIPIRFIINETGKMQNDCRDLMLEYLQSPKLKNGRLLADRLRSFTTQKSGLGLFFIMSGGSEATHRLVLSRFPAEQGILAEEEKHSLKIEFIEKIFMKNALSYKAALFEGKSLDSDFWFGNVIDRQLNESNLQVANYWIHDFLKSDYKTTSKSGTRRLAVALRAATKDATLEEKQEIIAAISLSRGFYGKKISINGFLTQLGISTESKSKIIEKLQNPDTSLDTFIFDMEEFQKHASLTAVELNSGSIMVAPADKFDDCFKRELISKDTKEYKFTTKGIIIDEQLRGKRP